MFFWFKTRAPIRTKFKALLLIHGLWSALALAGAWLAGSGHFLGGCGLAAVAMAGSLLTVLISGRLICTPYVNTVLRMEALADGDTDSPIAYTDYGDCVGRMTKAMAVFRDNGVQVRSSAEMTEIVVGELAAGLDAMAAGNLTYSIERPFAGDYDRLRSTFNQTIEGLERSLGQVANSAASVNGGSAEIVRHPKT